MLTAVKYLHLLSLATWLGSVIFFSFVAAPSIFKNFERKMAGDIVGAIFPKYFFVNEICIIVAIITLAILGIKTDMTAAVKTGLILLGIALAFASYSGFANGPKARAVKAEIRAEKDESKIATLKKTFGKLHGISMAINVLNLLIGLGILFFSLRYLKI
jgi:uncharacterized membrane protein